jgi:uncharacterized membrane protein
MIRVLHIAVLVFLCLAGMFCSCVLLHEHIHGGGGQDWFARVCGESGEPGVSNCEKVIHSDWGMVRGKPTAYWGIAYYLGLIVWFLLVGRPSPDRRYWHWVPTLVTLGGAAISVALVVMLYTRFEKPCPWCLAAHAVNGAVLVTTLLLWPRRVAPAAEGATPVVSPRRHPTFRLVVATIALAVLADAYFWRGVYHQLWIRRMLVSTYLLNPRHDLALLDDEVERVDDGSDGGLTVVVFTDFECGNCARFSAAMEKNYGPLFDHRLRTVFKHYPYCNDCNPYVARRTHPAACQAARAAEAARIQGGLAAFRRAHASLLASAASNELGTLDVRQLATSLNLDPDRFVADMASEPVAQRIRDDVELAHRLGVRATPAVFINGREVPEEAHLEKEFWTTLARRSHAAATSAPADGSPSIPAFGG